MKKNKFRANIVAFIYTLCLVHFAILFRFICNEPIQALLWWISVIFLITGFSTFLLSINKNIRQKRKTFLAVGELLFTSIGAILFTINSFVFIKNIYVSIILVITVSLTILSLVLMQLWLVSEGKEEVEHKDVVERKDG